MKKILFTLLISLCLLPVVKAETSWYNSTYSYSMCSVYYDTNTSCIFNDIDSLYEFPKKREILNELYERLISQYNSIYKQDYPYYFISWETSLSDRSLTNSKRADPSLYVDTPGSITAFSIYMFKFIPDLTNFTSTLAKEYYDFSYFSVTYDFDFDTYTTSSIESFNVLYMGGFAPAFMFKNGYNSTYYTYIPSYYYDSNFNLIYTYDFNVNIPDYNNLSFTKGDIIPTQRSLSTFKDPIVTVNLDDYEYVILNLKDYSKKEAFETNLQVKGSIAITPVYEFGTVEKETITDVCNISYSDFTDYRFFVLKNDLINSAVYIVKNCQEDTSSFRFDSSVFDITYVTAENVNDPVITFGGVEYHTIPFNKLSNTVNKNEEEGFIPGENGSSLTDVIDNITNYISSFWNSLSTFMGLVTKFFNTLPIEIRAISITAFTTALTLGVIKFIKS